MRVVVVVLLYESNYVPCHCKSGDIWRTSLTIDRFVKCTVFAYPAASSSNEVDSFLLGVWICQEEEECKISIIVTFCMLAIHCCRSKHYSLLCRYRCYLLLSAIAAYHCQQEAVLLSLIANIANIFPLRYSWILSVHSVVHINICTKCLIQWYPNVNVTS